MSSYYTTNAIQGNKKPIFFKLWIKFNTKLNLFLIYGIIKR